MFVHRPARLLYASFRPRLAAIALALSLTLHLHQVGWRTFTSKLLSMPSTRLNRSRGRTLRLTTRRRLRGVLTNEAISPLPAYDRRHDDLQVRGRTPNNALARV